MSFRSRLLLFFTIIVVVPMGAVALVLFSITSQSEIGKADARIAEGLRVAFAVYRQDRAEAVPELVATAFDDPSWRSNPRMPLISELSELFWKAYEGRGARELAGAAQVRTA